MAYFTYYEPKLKKVEGYGIYTNKASDLGGATMSGVTLTTFRQYFGSDKTVSDLKKMTEAQWRYIFKRGYWDKAGADNIKNQSVAELIVDFCVNSGVGMLKKVQSLLGVAADGVIGPKSIAAINGANQQLLFNAIMAERRSKYFEIVAYNNGQKVNLQGWLNRLKMFTFK